MLCTGVCALTAYLNANLVINGFIAMMLVMAANVYLCYKVTNIYDNDRSRIGYLWALSGMFGLLLGPVLHQINLINPMILIQAVSYTAIVFGSFTAVALFSKRRSYLFLGGIISSMVSAMFWYRMINWMFGTQAYYEGPGMFYLMCGLFVACMYIIYDTQIIIEKAERGDKDVPTHTMILFLDLIDLFMKILQILIKLSEDKDKKKRRD